MTDPAAHTETSGGHAPFPPFQSEYFPSQLCSLAVSFILLYVLMSRIALPRIGSILMARDKCIADDLGAAQRFKERSDAVNAAHGKSRADAQMRAHEIASATREKQAAEADTARKRLEVELNRRLAAAEESIATARAAAMRNIDAVATDVAAAIVERLTGSMRADRRIAYVVGDSAAG